jgi:NTP pyrophosphatase (non-canonical NTP hydrolase)
MQLNEYQQKALETAIYPGKDEKSVIYPALGLAGESGEVVEKVKKLLRDKGGVVDDKFVHDVTLELGDVLWYVAVLADAIGMTLNDVAQVNIAKLNTRKFKGTLSGSGDHR